MENIEQNIHFAFAVNKHNEFEKKHFGDSDKFVIYEWNGNEFTQSEGEINTFKDDHEDEHEHHHGDKKKGKQIIKLLKSKGVKVLVSEQFGRNIKMINQHFIPVITSDNNIEDVLRVLPKFIPRVMEDIKEQPENHKLIDLRKK